jgi:hypothetical protein
MKRKETSKLLNEWKSFLNESPETAMLDREALAKFDKFPDPAEIDESLKSIMSSLFEMGLEQKDVDQIIDQIKMLSPNSIDQLNDEFSSEAFGGNLEEDPHLSEN